MMLQVASHITHHFFEWMKLAEIALLHVISSIEDEYTTFSIAFLKLKLCNGLDKLFACYGHICTKDFLP